MNKSEFNQGVSFKVFASDKVRANGTSTLYLRVTIERKKREFNLKQYWPLSYFDSKRELVLPRHAKDTEAKNVNLIIEEAKGRSNRIKLRYFTDAKRLTLDLFAKEFENYDSRDNFLFYWEEKIKEVRTNGVISADTEVRHNTNLKRLTDFNAGEKFLSMSDLTPDLIHRYQDWLAKPKGDKPGLMYNTVTNALKCLQTYINHAITDGFKIPDPFEKISLKYNPGTREALSREELQALKKLYKDEERLEPRYREVLRKFLFSCYTGIRISDTSQVTRSMIKQGKLKVATKKGRRQGTVVEIPLPHYALSLVEGRKGLLFKPIADQDCNDYLKIIAARADIDKHLTFHVSRDTFATLFIEMGGDVHTLKELMGHHSIQTTMIYVKMSEKRKEILMDNFNTI